MRGVYKVEMTISPQNFETEVCVYDRDTEGKGRGSGEFGDTGGSEEKNSFWML